MFSSERERKELSRDSERGQRTEWLKIIMIFDKSLIKKTWIFLLVYKMFI